MSNARLTTRRAAVADVEALTSLHCSSFQPEEHVPMLLGRNYVAATYRWLVSSSQSYVLVACVEGRIVGLVAVCDTDFTAPMFLACFWEFVWSILRRPTLLARRRLWQRLIRRHEGPINSKAIEPPAGVAQMTIGAVDGAYRGRSVFPGLVEATKDVSRSRGSRAIRAGVYKVNAASRRVFEKGNWREAACYETEDTIFYVACLDETIATQLGLTQEAK